VSLIDFSKKIVPNFSNNSGDSKSAFGNAGSDLNNQLGAAGQTRINTDNVAGANSTSGFSSSQTGSNGTQQGQPELERVYTDTNKSEEQVGTNINEDNPVGGKALPQFTGRTSVINPYHLVRYHSLKKQDSENSPELTKLGVPNEDTNYNGLADNPAYKNPSTSFIIYHFNEGPGKKLYERKYSYSDFLYLKHYHPFNNNRLITLRRYMIPVYDECRVAIKDATPDLRRPIAQAFTYLDYSNNSLNTLTKMTVQINTKDIKGAGVDSNSTPTTLTEAADVLGLKDSTGVLVSDATQQVGIKMLSLLSGQTAQDKFSSWTSAYDPWSNGPLQDLVYGPVNVITGAKIRGRGLTFSHIGDLKIQFEYSSKTIEHVNQKAVMLDIFSNMLALTYNHALFWGGENRFLIDRANFPLVRAEAMYQFLKNKNISDASQNVAGSASTIFSNIENIFKSVSSGNLGEIFSNQNIEGIKSFFTQYALLENDKLKNFQKSILEGTKAELTGAPSGEWHLQVGNPFAPIMMLGNLWCTQCDFEFNNELSIDDFPTELKFTCTLKPGRERDASDVQSIFNSGGGRIYYPRQSGVDVNASSSTFNTEGTVGTKSDQALGATNRFSVDRSGERTSDLVKTKTENKYATSLFKPIKTFIGNRGTNSGQYGP
jgi:hypothetical protein